MVISRPSSHYGCPAEQLGAGIETFFLTPGYVISVSSENICRNSLSTPPYLRRRLCGRRHFARRACAVSHRAASESFTSTGSGRRDPDNVSHLNF